MNDIKAVNIVREQLSKISQVRVAIEYISVLFE